MSRKRGCLKTHPMSAQLRDLGIGTTARRCRKLLLGAASKRSPLPKYDAARLRRDRRPALGGIGILWRANDLVHIRGQARLDVAEAIAIVILGLRCPNPMTITRALAHTAGKMVSLVRPGC
jgi:hypothetical protein